MSSYFSRLPGQLYLLATLCLAVVGCTKNDNQVAAPQTVSDRVLEDSQFSFLRSAVAYAGVGDMLKDGNMTLFAPTDSAFQASGFSNVASIQAMSREQVRAMVLYHTLYGSISSARIPLGLNAVETVSKGVAFFIKSNDGTIHINNSKLTQADLSVANGYVHKINRVLTPSNGNLLTTIQNNPNLTFLAAAIQRIGTSSPTLVETLTSATSTHAVTVFAPNDDAFKASSQYNSLTSIESADPQTLANVLLYHMTSGVMFSSQLQTGSVTSLFNGNTFTVAVMSDQTTLKGNNNQTPALIKQADLPTTNGVIHIIDQVLQP